jgi:histidine triad (HIT) family protein
MTDCVFCRIVSGEIPSAKVYEDAQIIAFMDAGQVNPGHVLVAVKEHIKNIYDLRADLAAAVFQVAVRIAKAAKASMRPDGITLLQANEQAGWQTVEHFHIHVLPRHVDDGVNLTWPVKNPTSEELDRFADKVKSEFVLTSATER